MKKNRCVSLIILVVVVLLLILGILLLKFINREKEIYGPINRISINGYRVIDDYKVNSIFKVYKDGKYGFMNVKGNLLSELSEFETIEYIDDTHFMYSDSNNYHYIVDDNNDILFSNESFINVLSDIKDNKRKYYVSLVSDFNNIYDNNFNFIHEVDNDNNIIGINGDFIYTNDYVINYKTDEILQKKGELDYLGDYILDVLGDEISVYNILNDEWDKVDNSYDKHITFVDGSYLLINDNEQIYLTNSGRVIENPSKEIFKGIYSFDFSTCNSGFNILRNGKKVNNKCYDFLDSSLTEKGILGYDNSGVILKSGKLLKNVVIEDGFLLASNRDAIYDFEGKKLDVCESYFINVNKDLNICMDNPSHLYNSKFQKVSDEYDSITCNKKDVCVITDNGKSGLIIDNEIYIEPSYYNIILKSNYAILENNVGYDIVEFGNTTLPIKKEEFVFNGLAGDQEKIARINVNNVVKEYSLSDIKEIIDQNKDFFQKYAYYILNNSSINGYRRELFMIFPVIIENQKHMDENYFLRYLANLSISEANILNTDITGQYNMKYNSILLGYVNSSVIYHELIHFISNRLSHIENVEKIHKCSDKYLLNVEYKKIDSSDRKKCEPYYTSKANFIVEGGTEYFTAKYTDTEPNTYFSDVKNFEILMFLLGDEFMQDVYFSKDGGAMLFIEMMKYMNEDEYYEFISNLDDIGVNFGYVSSEVVNDIVKRLIDIYENKNEKSWYLDQEFMKYLVFVYESVSLDDKDALDNNYQSFKKNYYDNH